MPEAIELNVKETKSEIMGLLSNGHEVTTKDLLRFMVVMEDQVGNLARVHLDCEARRWVGSISAKFMQTMTTMILIGLGILVYEIVSRGLKLP